MLEAATLCVYSETVCYACEPEACPLAFHLLSDFNSFPAIQRGRGSWDLTNRFWSCIWESASWGPEGGTNPSLASCRASQILVSHCNSKTNFFLSFWKFLWQWESMFYCLLFLIRHSQYGRIKSKGEETSSECSVTVSSPHPRTFTHSLCKITMSLTEPPWGDLRCTQSLSPCKWAKPSNKEAPATDKATRSPQLNLDTLLCQYCRLGLRN